MQSRSIVTSHRGGPFHRTADRSEPFGRQASKSDSATETSLKTPTGWIRPAALEIPPDRLRLREACSLVPGGELSRRALHAPIARHRSPQASLCSRLTRWLCVGLGMAGIAGIARAAAAPQGNAACMTTPPIDSEGPDPRLWDVTPLAAPCGEVEASRSHPSLRDELHYPELTKTQLTAAIDAALAGGDPQTELLMLAILQTSHLGSRLSLSGVDKMVDAYRDSRHWRETLPMKTFMQTMIRATDLAEASDAHLERLLRVWQWRYGDDDVFKPEKQKPFDSKVMRNSIIWQVAAALGHGSITQSQLAILIGVASREPEGIPPGKFDDGILLKHAWWVTGALSQVMASTNPQPLFGPGSEQAELDTQHVLACLQHFFRTPAKDSRWKPLVLLMLDRGGPVLQSPRIDPARWKALLVEAARLHLDETRTTSRPVTSLDEAISAMLDPDLFASGQSYTVITGRSRTVS